MKTICHDHYNFLYSNIVSLLYFIINSAFSYLKRNQETDCLHGIVSSINIVSHEEVISIWGLSPDPKQLHEVMKLTMDISTHRHWTSHLLHIGLF